MQWIWALYEVFGENVPAWWAGQELKAKKYNAELWWDGQVWISIPKTHLLCSQREICVDLKTLTCDWGNWLSGVKQSSVFCKPATGFGQYSAACWADVLAAAGHLGHVHAAITPLSPAFLSGGDVNNLISPWTLKGALGQLLSAYKDRQPNYRGLSSTWVFLPVSEYWVSSQDLADLHSTSCMGVLKGSQLNNYLPWAQRVPSKVRADSPLVKFSEAVS